MRPVLIVTHLADRQVGLVRDALEASGCDVIERHAAAGDTLPVAGEVGGIVSLGGRQSATRADEDPFLAAEVALLRAALDDEVPVLGMCLGAQLLAVAAGGEVVNSGRIYADWPDLVLTPAASADPLFGGLPPRLPVLKWHEDVIELTDEQPLLARAEGPGAALFRIGSSAWGSQAHLELTPEMLVDVWLADPAEAADVIAAGHDLDEFRARSRELLVGQMAAATPMFEAFGQIAARRG
jgi:GMP synthase-like glutamine amidotransferase